MKRLLLLAPVLMISAAVGADALAIPKPTKASRAPTSRTRRGSPATTPAKPKTPPPPTAAEKFTASARKRTGETPLCVCRETTPYSIGRMWINDPYESGSKTGLVHTGCTILHFADRDAGDDAGRETNTELCQDFMPLIDPAYVKFEL